MLLPQKKTTTHFNKNVVNWKRSTGGINPDIILWKHNTYYTLANKNPPKQDNLASKKQNTSQTNNPPKKTILQTNKDPIPCGKMICLHQS